MHDKSGDLVASGTFNCTQLFRPICFVSVLVDPTNSPTMIMPVRGPYERLKPLYCIREALDASALSCIFLGRNIQTDDSRCCVLLLWHVLDCGNLLCSPNECGFNTNDMYRSHDTSKETTVLETLSATASLGKLRKPERLSASVTLEHITVYLYI